MEVVVSFVCRCFTVDVMHTMNLDTCYTRHVQGLFQWCSATDATVTTHGISIHTNFLFTGTWEGILDRIMRDPKVTIFVCWTWVIPAWLMTGVDRDDGSLFKREANFKHQNQWNHSGVLMPIWNVPSYDTVANFDLIQWHTVVHLTWYLFMHV